MSAQTECEPGDKYNESETIHSEPVDSLPSEPVGVSSLGAESNPSAAPAIVTTKPVITRNHREELQFSVFKIGLGPKCAVLETMPFRYLAKFQLREGHPRVNKVDTSFLSALFSESAPPLPTYSYKETYRAHFPNEWMLSGNDKFVLRNGDIAVNNASLPVTFILDSELRLSKTFEHPDKWLCGEIQDDRLVYCIRKGKDAYQLDLHHQFDNRFLCTLPVTIPWGRVSVGTHPSTSWFVIVTGGPSGRTLDIYSDSQHHHSRVKLSFVPHPDNCVACTEQYIIIGQAFPTRISILNWEGKKLDSISVGQGLGWNGGVQGVHTDNDGIVQVATGSMSNLLYVYSIT